MRAGPSRTAVPSLCFAYPSLPRMWVLKRGLPWPGGGCAGARTGAPVRELGLEGVLDLLTCVLEVALGLIGLALSLQVPVVGGLAGLLLGLALHFLDLVLQLVLGTHRDSPRRELPFCLPRALP